MKKTQIWLPIAIVLGLITSVSVVYIYKSFKNISISSTTNQKEENITPNISQKEAIAYVSKTYGASTKISQSLSSQVTTGDVLYTWDILKTDIGGAVELIYIDSSIIRITESSIYELRDANTGRLESGSLWARIIRPITETKIFTLESSDLSAWVRGTAVSMRTNGSGSELTVVDSSIDKNAVDIQATTASGIIQTSLSPEESISTFDVGGSKKTRVNMQRLLADSNIIYNIKNDILYLVELKKSWTPSSKPINLSPIDGATSKKIEQEILASLPKNTELQGFFESKAIELEYSQVSVNMKTATGISTLTPWDEERIRILFSNEITLMQMKSELQILRTKNVISNDESKKDEFQKSVNSLQEKIQEFDQDFIKSYPEQIKHISEKSSIEQGFWIESSGSTIESTGSVEIISSEKIPDISSNNNTSPQVWIPPVIIPTTSTPKIWIVKTPAPTIETSQTWETKKPSLSGPAIIMPPTRIKVSGPAVPK